jgi:hypothetical protein
LASAGHCLAGATLGPGVGAGPLPPDWQVMAVPVTPIATNLDKALNVKVNLFSEVTLNPVLSVNYLPQAINLILSEVVQLSFRAYFGLSQDFLAQGRADAVNVLQRYPGLFISR